MTLRNVAIYIGAVLPTSAAIGFGLSRFSKERFETNVKKLELITPHYNELVKALDRSQIFFVKAKGNLIRTIGSTLGPDLYGDRESLSDYLNREPFRVDTMNFPVSGHLPKKCQHLVKNLMFAFEDNVRTLNEVVEHYRIHTFFQDVFEDQKSRLNERQNITQEKISEILDLIETDKLRLTRSVRRRRWI